MVLQLSLLEIILEKHAGGICHSSLCVSTKQKKTFSMIIFLIKRENVKDLMMWVTKRSVLIFIYLFSSRSAQKCFQRYATVFSVPSFVNIEELWECNVYVWGERTITVHQMHFHIFVNKTFGTNNCLCIKIHMICLLLWLCLSKTSIIWNSCNPWKGCTKWATGVLGNLTKPVSGTFRPPLDYNTSIYLKAFRTAIILKCCLRWILAPIMSGTIRLCGLSLTWCLPFPFTVKNTWDSGSCWPILRMLPREEAIFSGSQSLR